MLMFLLKVGFILSIGVPIGVGFNIAWLFFIGKKRTRILHIQLKNSLLFLLIMIKLINNKLNKI